MKAILLSQALENGRDDMPTSETRSWGECVASLMQIPIQDVFALDHDGDLLFQNSIPERSTSRHSPCLTQTKRCTTPVRLSFVDEILHILGHVIDHSEDAGESEPIAVYHGVNHEDILECARAVSDGSISANGWSCGASFAYLFPSAVSLYSTLWEHVGADEGSEVAAWDRTLASLHTRTTKRFEEDKATRLHGIVTNAVPKQTASPQQGIEQLSRIAPGSRVVFDLDNWGAAWRQADDAPTDPAAPFFKFVRECRARATVLTSEGESGRTAMEARLRGLGICPFSLISGKPKADVYVTDSKLWHLHSTQSQNLGWNLRGPPPTNESRNDLTFGFIKARHFNKVVLNDDEVVGKTSTSTAILGECYFYLTVPPSLASHFPILKDVELTSTEDSFRGIKAVREKLSEGSIWHSFVSLRLLIERLHGPSVSHLLTNRCLTARRFEGVLRTLHKLHLSKNHDAIESACSVNVYDNYARKLRHRYETYKTSAYRTCSPDISKAIHRIAELLDDYEKGRKACVVQVIHGDPVLSNIVSMADGSFKFLDMRGLHGTSNLCIGGDAVYDIAKCLQSICGYDFICQGRPIGDADHRLMSEMYAIFCEFIRVYYPTVRLRDVVLVTASLYASLIPLHPCPRKRTMYGQQCLRLARAVEQCIADDIPFFKICYSDDD